MKFACKGFEGDYSDRCQFDDAWFCKNKNCKEPVLTSTLFGVCPSGCPLVYPWNMKEIIRKDDEKGEMENE